MQGQAPPGQAQRAVGVAEQPAQARPQDEAQAEHPAQKPEGARPLFRRGDVGEIGEGRPDRRGGHARDRAAEQQPPDRGGERHQQVVRPVPQVRGQYDRPAAVPVRKGAHDGLAEELHEGPGPDQGAGPEARVGRRAGEPPNQGRQHRRDQAQRHDVEQQGEEDAGDRQGPPLHRRRPRPLDRLRNGRRMLHHALLRPYRAPSTWRAAIPPPAAGKPADGNPCRAGLAGGTASQPRCSTLTRVSSPTASKRTSTSVSTPRIDPGDTSRKPAARERPDAHASDRENLAVRQRLGQPPALDHLAPVRIGQGGQPAVELRSPSSPLSPLRAGSKLRAACPRTWSWSGRARRRPIRPGS